MIICLERDADFSKILIGFTFLVLAYPGSPGKGPLNGCVCVFLDHHNSRFVNTKTHNSSARFNFRKKNYTD